MKQAVKYKRWLRYYFLVAIAPVFMLAFLLYCYDPMMLFHKPWGRDITLDKNMRLQAAGVIRSLDYDAYILGTSMLENTSAFKASEVLGNRFANISISGSDFFERSFPLNIALKKGAKHIVYSVDDYYITRREGHPSLPFEDFYYLYEGGLRQVGLYLQHKYIYCAIMLSDSIECLGRSSTLDMPNEWFSRPDLNERFGGLDNWFSSYNDRRVRSALRNIVSMSSAIKENKYSVLEGSDLQQEIKLSLEYVDKYILSYVEGNPLTRFDLIFPPYSRIRYAEWHQLNGTKAKIHEAVVRHLANASSRLDNLNVFGYEDQDFIDNIENYRDTGHYALWVNEMQIDSIVKDVNNINDSTVDLYIDLARGKAVEFDLVSLGERIKEKLDEL